MNILLIDNLELVRKALAVLINSQEDMRVVADTGDIHSAINLIDELIPDIVIIKSRIGNVSCSELAFQCKSKYPNIKIMVIALGINGVDFMQCYKSGIDGYILMQAAPEELIYGLRMINKSKKYFDTEVLDFLTYQTINPINELTSRELDVLVALGYGMKNSLIAKRLYITEFTVKKHISQILSKLNLRDRTEAALYANKIGIVDYKFKSYKEVI